MEESDQDKEMKEDIMKVFNDTEIYHGKIDDYSILYKVTYDTQALHFLLYDYEAVYSAKQPNCEISSLNKSLNSSLEFNQLTSLVGFLIENIFKAESNLCISKQKVSDLLIFSYEIVVDILNVKWLFSSKRINNMQLAQCLFIKPLNNIIISFGYLINSAQEVILVGKGNSSAVNVSDAVTLINNAYANKNQGFSKLMGVLTKESTRKINEAKYGKSLAKESSNVPLSKKEHHPDKRKTKEVKSALGAQYVEDSNQLSKDNDNDDNAIPAKNKKSKKKKLKFI